MFSHTRGREQQGALEVEKGGVSAPFGFFDPLGFYNVRLLCLGRLEADFSTYWITIRTPQPPIHKWQGKSTRQKKKLRESEVRRDESKTKRGRKQRQS